MDELRNIILELIGIFKELIPIEKVKLTAAAGYNVVSLEECMKKEQAAILKLKGLDRRREELMEAQGWSGKSFRQILEHYEGGDKKELDALFQELDRQMGEFREMNGDANEVIRTNLHTVEKLADEARIYQGRQNEDTKELHFTSRKA